MRENIRNLLNITCEGVDLTNVSQLEVYMRQGDVFYQYTPEVIGAQEMFITIPFEDALSLEPSPVRLQFTFMDADGNPRASEIVQMPVGQLLKGAGYDPA